MNGYDFPAYCERVISGDSYQLRVDLGFHVAISIFAHLRGADCPPRNTPEGSGASIYVKKLLRPAILFWENGGPQPLQIRTHRDRQYFNRWLVDIELTPPDEDTIDLADALILANHAKPVE